MRTYTPGFTFVEKRESRYCYGLKQPFYSPEDENTAKQLKRMNFLYSLISEVNHTYDERNTPGNLQKWEKELVELERIFYPGEPDLYFSLILK